MRLTKKHIGQLFDNAGSDGSWAYQLVAVKRDELLFQVVGETERFEIDSNKFLDWRPFIPVLPSKRAIQAAWATARRA